MSFRVALLAVLLVAGAPVFAQSSAYDDERAGYVQRNDREIGSVFEFEAPLARYGDWVPSRYGRAWHPRVPAEWRPYTVGRWVDGPDGESWQSDEPWGWATYHYGRWGFDDRWGWVWVPDTEWAPAWVAWRDGDQYSGWAPLPPRSGYGYDVDAWDYSQWYAPSWVYVPRASLYRRNVGSVALPWRSGRNYWNVTRGSYRDRDPSRSYGGQRRQGGYDGGLIRPELNNGRPLARPQDRPGDAGNRSDFSSPDRAQDARPGRERPPGYGQAMPRPDRRPGFVPFNGGPGQPQPGADRGRVGRGGPAVAPGGVPAPGTALRPGRTPPPAAAPPPRQARPGPPSGSPQRQPQANPRTGREDLRKRD